MGKDHLAEVLQFFDPLEASFLQDIEALGQKGSIGAGMLLSRENKPLCADQKFEIAIVGLSQFGVTSGEPSYRAANQIRKQFYGLKQFAGNLRIADLGNLKTGTSKSDSQFALQEACALLFEKKIQVLIIGGDQDFVVGQARAFKQFESDVNLVIVDSRFDLLPENTLGGVNGFINELISNEATYIYNISMVAYQSYFVDQHSIQKFDQNHFDYHRLGEVRSSSEEMETIMRDSDLVSFDLSAIRVCDCPGVENASPNGLYAEEACVLSRYAGISDRNRSFAIHGYYPAYDVRNQSAQCAAQILWYYLEGFHQRKHDYPSGKLENCTKYSVAIDEIDFPIVFYKSELTQRWWLEVSNMEKNTEKFTKIVVACSEADYLKACRNELPERWWINFKKLR